TAQYEVLKNNEETAQRLEHILRATKTGIDIIDKNFNLLFVDNYWQTVYGSPEGRKCYEYFKDRREPCENCGVPRALETKRIMVSEQILPKEGNRVVACQVVPFQNKEGEWQLAEFKTDITQRKLLEEKLKYQLQFEKLVSGISGSFVAAGAGKIDEMINLSLRRAGKFFEADRGVVFQLSPNGETMESTHEWCYEGIKPLENYLKRFSRGSLSWLHRQVQKITPFYIEEIERLPEEAQAEKWAFRRQGIKSFLILPFSAKSGALASGFLAFDSVREKKSWTEEQVELLSIVADTISGALARQQLEEQRHRALEALEHERKVFEDVLELTLSGYWDWDLKNNTQYLSPAFKKMFGYEEDELPNRQESWQRIIFKDDLPTTQALLKQHFASKGKVPYSFEVRYQHRDGSTVWAICAGRVVEWEPDGRPRRMVGCHVDITGLKRAEEALKKSEENLAVTLRSIGDGVIATDGHGKITRLNPRAEKLTGWPEEEAVGRPLEEVFRIIDAKTGAPAPSPAYHVLKVGKTIRLANDTTLIARNGKKFPIADSAAPIHDDTGKIIGVVIVFSDVTEQYRAREALRESELRYRTIVENNNDALFIRDFAGKIIDLNNTACRMLGYKRRELLGANVDMIHSPRERELASVRTSQLMKNDQLLFEGELMHRDGRPVPVEVSIKVVSREGGGLIQSFVRDITERKESERQIAKYTSELEGLYLKLDEEINKARQVHERTLPKSLPRVKGLSFAAHYQPAEKLGGDFYDVERVGKKLIIYLSDVTGHGVDGAMLSVFVKHTIKGYLSFSPGERIHPDKILRYLSVRFRQKSLPAEYFICIFLAVLDLETMELTYTAAGFQDTPLVRLGNGERLKLVSRGLFLSPAFSEELLNLQEKGIKLTPGTTIFFNTDGLTEQLAGGEYYGKRLPGVFYGHSHLPPQSIAEIIREDFRQFNGGSLQGRDDITFLVLKVESG
ncbi:MAG: PAS domain S-box protein, partial [Dethiobacteria bacterium]